MTKQPTFIDLFCGCGGWTEGFSQLGYKCLYSVDFWAPAALAHSINHPGITDDDTAKNILDPAIAETIKTKLKKGEVDILIGSPPCTQFSFSNRGGGGNTVEGMVLVRRFLEFVDYVQNDLMKPDFPWVMENVPRLKVFLEKECIDKDDNLYRLNYVDEPEIFYKVVIPKVVVLVAADYGAPQKRRRVFCGNFAVPKPTHISPEVRDNPKKRHEFIKNYEITEAECENLLPWRTLGDIINNLPNPISKPDRDSAIVDPNYPSLQISVGDLHDHFYDTRLRPGIELFESHVMKQHHPVYGVMNFPDDENKPGRTVMATEMVVSRETMIVPVKRGFKPKTLGKRSYEEVLQENRSDGSGGYRRLTVRELACVQGFPITYQLSGKSSGVKHKQIGNAVSPFISRAFGRMFADRFLSQPAVADTNNTDLTLNRPSDIKDYAAYDYTQDWIQATYKKNSHKFYAHLRTTKVAGQRIDLMIDAKGDASWKPILCLGSGKSYKRTEINGRIISEMLAGLERAANGLNGEVKIWTKEILNQIDNANLSCFNRVGVADYFDANGKPMHGSPIFFIEEGLDQMVRQVVNGSYQSLWETTSDVNFSEFDITRPINAYTVLAAIAMEKLTREANSACVR